MKACIRLFAPGFAPRAAKKWLVVTLGLVMLAGCRGERPQPASLATPSPETAFEWRPFLQDYSRDLLADATIRAAVPPNVLESGWMGFEGATEGQIEALEARLGKRLPPSYRSFLMTSNGWRQTGPFIFRMYGADEVDWFRKRNSDWINAWTLGLKPVFGPSIPDGEYFVYGERQDPARLRVEYLQDALEIAPEGDSAIYLLNPDVVSQDGEWEAWFFANWLPGAARYRSFGEMMAAEKASLQGFKATGTP